MIFCSSHFIRKPFMAHIESINLQYCSWNNAHSGTLGLPPQVKLESRQTVLVRHEKYKSMTQNNDNTFRKVLSSTYNVLIKFSLNVFFYRFFVQFYLVYKKIVITCNICSAPLHVLTTYGNLWFSRHNYITFFIGGTAIKQSFFLRNSYFHYIRDH